MAKAVIKNAAYTLIHLPEMVMTQGTTQTTEKITNPNSEYLVEVPKNLRTYEEAVNYAPTQTYIGNMTPQELLALDVNKSTIGIDVNGKRDGRFGEILPEIEFIALMKICDAFDLVLLEEGFAAKAREAYSNNPISTPEEIAKLEKAFPQADIDAAVSDHGEAIYYEGKVVGVVKRAHDVDKNLTAHIMFENLVVKASGVHAFKHLLLKNNIDPNTIDYVIECSEEACGDMNQRGGGNFAKSIAEVVGCSNASGSDVRGFCAAPAHSLVNASSLVSSGTFENVVVVAGGATAKLGMNGQSHLKKGVPILEDVIGAFAILISKNDGVSPVLRNDIVGVHTVSAGGAPQAVTNALVKDPLYKAGLKITDVDKFAGELHDADVMRNAPTGDVSESVTKMIGAVAAMNGEIERADIAAFVEKHGLRGWAPSQGHIPSGVPYLGFAIDDLTTGSYNRVQVIGKGSLFLGRMTNLFDGVSIVVERNNGEVEEGGANDDKINKLIAKAMRNFAGSLLEEENE